MSKRLRQLIEELETLPAHAIDSVADMVDRWKDTDPERRYHLLDRTAGALSSEEAGELEAATQECRRIDTTGR